MRTLTTTLVRRFLFIGLTIITLTGSLASLIPAVTQAQGTGYFPAQFIAKQYSEALGRMPDQTSWQSMRQHFAQQGCNAAMLSAYGESFFNSSEYANLGYDNAGKLLTLYRGALNREPDQGGFNSWLAQLNGGLSWQTAVQAFFTSSEFNNLVPQICGGGNGRSTSYYWGTTPAPLLPTTGSATNSANFMGTQTQLQALLNSAAGNGGNVALAQKAVIALQSPLTIPAGVTLTTNGLPDTRHYALMGRLVRGTTAFNDQLIYVDGGAKLQNVWVDGSRDNPSNFQQNRSNIRVLGGVGTSVSNDKISNSAGPSNILALGTFDGYPCGSMALNGNMITAYSSDNKLQSAWTDGMSVTCENTTIQNNQIIDTSDAGIVLFRSCPSVKQQAPGVIAFPAQGSLVSNNTILSAGNSMYVAFGADPLMAEPGYAPETCSFKGSSITNNVLWTSPDTHFAIGITVGTRAWYGASPNVNTGDGASVTNNTTGSLSANVETGIAVSGMLNATVQNNSATWLHPGNIDSCPNVDFAASISAGTASAAPQTYFPSNTLDTTFDGCIAS